MTTSATFDTTWRRSSTDVPAIGHLAVGLVAARAAPAPRRVSTAVWAVLLIVASYAPDLDVLAFSLGIPYGAPWGHRGAVHSPVFAVLCGAAIGLIAWRAWRLSFWRVATVFSVVMASHGLLDAFTDGGRGVALLWPWSDARFFAPLRPIPVAPIGAGMFSVRGAAVVAWEILLFAPLFLYGLWPLRHWRPVS